MGVHFYTKEKTKTQRFGTLLEEQGAVNADVIKQLAASALERSPANIAIAIMQALNHST